MYEGKMYIAHHIRCLNFQAAPEHVGTRVWTVGNTLTCSAHALTSCALESIGPSAALFHFYIQFPARGESLRG